MLLLRHPPLFVAFLLQQLESRMLISSIYKASRLDSLWSIEPKHALFPQLQQRLIPMLFCTTVLI